MDKAPGVILGLLCIGGPVRPRCVQGHHNPTTGTWSTAIKCWQAAPGTSSACEPYSHELCLKK